MPMTWLNPVYAGQILTGITGIGGIFADGEVTSLRLFLATIAALSLLTSLLIAVRAEGESGRVRRHLETLVRSMEVPYSVVEAFSKLIQTTAKKYGWAWTKQENFKNETVYDFQAEDGQKGLLVVSDREFKDLLILEGDEQIRAIEKRLFGTSSGDLRTAPTQDDEHLGEVIREVASEEVDGPHWCTVDLQPDGTLVYRVGRAQEDAGRVFLRLTADRRQELGRMMPIRRYAVVADEVRKSLSTAI